MSNIRIVAEMNLIPGSREELMPFFKKLVESSRAEPGNISYELVETLDDPNHLFVIENWESREALEKHKQTPHFLEFARAAEGKRRDNKVSLLKKLL